MDASCGPPDSCPNCWLLVSFVVPHDIDATILVKIPNLGFQQTVVGYKALPSFDVRLSGSASSSSWH